MEGTHRHISSVGIGNIHTCQLDRRSMCFQLSYESGQLRLHPGHNSQMKSGVGAPQGLQMLYHQPWTASRCLPCTPGLMANNREAHKMRWRWSRTVNPTQVGKNVPPPQNKTQLGKVIENQWIIHSFLPTNFIYSPYPLVISKKYKCQYNIHLLIYVHHNRIILFIIQIFSQKT